MDIFKAGRRQPVDPYKFPMTELAKPIDVLFEDHHLIAVHKPAGVLTQAPPHVPSMEAMVKDYIKVKYSKPAGVYLGIPHRLDRPVAGVVLFCRNTKAAQRVAEQFQNHTVQKTYWAWVAGNFPEETGEWRDFLRKIPETAKAEITAAGEAGAKEAITGFRVLCRRDSETLLELKPRTGRMHQLRIQAASRGFPISGDELYGSGRVFGPVAELPRDRLIALLARQLTLKHPFRDEQLTIESRLPEAFVI